LIQGDLANGDIDKAQKGNRAHHIEMGEGSVIDVLQSRGDQAGV